MRFRATAFGILALFLLAIASGAQAQDADKAQPSSTPNTTASQPPVLPGGQRAGSSSSRGNTSASGETRRLPEDSTTKQTITVNGRTLSFTATAGSLRLFNGKGEPQADIVY